MQGDITGIVNASGTKVVEYTYDAWGNILSVSRSLAATLGRMNPIRYRGYVYDEETGLYYLTSRYYEPSSTRFINGDGIIQSGTSYSDTNMFAYCGNIPTSRVDSTGYSWIDLWEKITQLFSAYSTAYAGLGGLALIDGPLPIGDMIAVAGTAILTAYATGSTIVAIKNDEREQAIPVTKTVQPSPKQTVFPENLQFHSSRVNYASLSRFT